MGHEGIPTHIESLSRNRTIPKPIRWNVRSSQRYVYQYLIICYQYLIKSISHDIKFMIYVIPIKCDHIFYSPYLNIYIYILSLFLYLPIISHPRVPGIRWCRGASTRASQRTEARSQVFAAAPWLRSIR